MARIDKYFLPSRPRTEGPGNSLLLELNSGSASGASENGLNCQLVDEMAVNRMSFMLSTGLETPPEDLGEVLKQVQVTAPINERRQLQPLPARGMELELSRFVQELNEANAQLRETQSQLTAQVTALEREVAQRTAQLDQNAADLAALYRAFAHDLQEPFGTLTDLSQRLLKENAGALEESGRGHAKRIADAGTRLGRCLDDVLRYGQVSCEKPVCENVALEVLVSVVVGQRLDVIAAKRAEVRSHRPLRSVRADAGWLREALGHLLDNSLKFVGPGILPRVQIWCEWGPTMVRIYVEDNGIGIPVEHQQRVFGLFQRLSDEHPGNGVGLAFVRRAAEQMGGKAGVESVPGQGSRFWIDLPKPE